MTYGSNKFSFHPNQPMLNIKDILGYFPLGKQSNDFLISYYIKLDKQNNEFFNILLYKAECMFEPFRER